MGNKLLALLTLLAILATPLFAEEISPTILSIIPGQGAPGNQVIISGSGFTPDSALFLGIEEIPLQKVSAKQLSFEIPQLPTGNYALYIRQKSGAASKGYSFNVLPLKPQITALSPDAISMCANGAERDISIKGKNFADNARVVLDGAIISGKRSSAEEITFRLPTVQGGVHQIQVRNGDDAVSTAVAMVTANRPEIVSVTQGDDFVNYYELKIEGTNFQSNSTMIVEGRRIQVSSGNGGERDRVIYNGCRNLTYQRYPYDPSVKSFQMLVVNPSGEESAPFTVTAP